MADTNTTAVINKVVQKGTHVIDGMHLDLYSSIQPWINSLYTGKYSAYFSESVFGIPVANLVAAILVFLFFLLLRKVFSSWVVAALLHVTKKTATPIDDMIVRELVGPIRFWFIVLGLQIFFQLIFRETAWIRTLLESAMIFTVFWILYAVTPSTRALLGHVNRGNEHLSYELTNFLIRMLRLTIIFFGIVAILYNFGINVTAFFASLGIGGLALALAAKDTAANLFGSIALLVDRSIRTGEWIKVNGIEGVIEDIGMRTTKIRTFEKSIIAIPNSLVATQPIENFSRRGIRRIKFSIGLTYNTTREQIEEIIQSLRTHLAENPKIAQGETQLVNFRDFNASDLGILVYAFAVTSQWESYLDIQQEINLTVMRIVEEHGASFAFPSRSIYFEQGPQTPHTTPEVPSPTPPKSDHPVANQTRGPISSDL